MWVWTSTEGVAMTSAEVVAMWVCWTSAEVVAMWVWTSAGLVATGRCTGESGLRCPLPTI
eukprot:1339819-Rhodomonas_salina.1